ncbi:MAG: hypothetical protein P0120_08375 [Nitrospira sp.]|nr:hypothetical protein [Nitrospira sp.]
MSSDRPKRESMSLEEATISNMWEIAALVKVLEKKGICTKQDLVKTVIELRKKKPRAQISETLFLHIHSVPSDCWNDSPSQREPGGANLFTFMLKRLFLSCYESLRLFLHADTTMYMSPTMRPTKTGSMSHSIIASHLLSSHDRY